MAKTVPDAENPDPLIRIRNVWKGQENSLQRQQLGYVHTANGWYAVCTGTARSVAVHQAIAYYRVSTARQGRSGLGIEAQRETVRRFAAAEGYDLAEEFVEVETGKGSDALNRRPQLAVALAAGRQNKCPIIS